MLAGSIQKFDNCSLQLPNTMVQTAISANKRLLLFYLPSFASMLSVA